MKRRLSVLTGALAIVLATSVIYASELQAPSTPDPEQEISDVFDAIQQNLTTMKLSDEPLIDQDGILITPEEFIFYKGAIELVGSIPHEKVVKAELTDEEKMDVLLTNRLLVREARDRGIQVSKEEVDEVIAFEKEVMMMEDDPDNDFVRELMWNRIRITGMSFDEFYSSDFARNAYEEQLLVGRLSSLLVEEGVIAEGMNFNQYTEDLLKANKAAFAVNWSSIKR